MDNFDAGLKLENIVLIFTFCGVFQIITKLISTYYNDVYLPVSNIKIEKYVRNMIYDKARKIDLAAYDTPEIYRKFTLAMSDSSGRIIELYENMVTLVGTFSVSYTHLDVYKRQHMYFSCRFMQIA